MDSSAPRLIVVAHGTAVDAGRLVVESLVDDVRASRPDADVQLCYLDVLSPRLPEVLDERPAVVVPALLSTGYHVQTDIPAALAAFPRTALARHLGPHPLLAEALAERVAQLGPSTGGPVVLVGAGSSRAEAADELATAGLLLCDRLGRAVTVTTTARLPEALESAREVLVVPYLLAPGRFADQVRALSGSVAEPIGAHRAVTELVWLRYDEAAPAVR